MLRSAQKQLALSSIIKLQSCRKQPEFWNLREKLKEGCAWMPSADKTKTAKVLSEPFCGFFDGVEGSRIKVLSHAIYSLFGG